MFITLKDCFLFSKSILSCSHLCLPPIWRHVFSLAHDYSGGAGGGAGGGASESTCESSQVDGPNMVLQRIASKMAIGYRYRVDLANCFTFSLRVWELMGTRSRAGSLSQPEAPNLAEVI